MADLHCSQVKSRYNFAAWWHLLSLDAPTVAALWCWFFARAMRLRIPLLAALLLAGATWLFYVADRILDGFGGPSSELRERHTFHARHRRAFIVASLVLAGPLAWMILTRMYFQTLRDEVFLSVFALLYLLLVHVAGRFARIGRSGWLPKELAVGVLFAAATAVPSWSRMGRYPDLAKERLAVAVVLFAVLCWVNCVAIEKWETVRPVAFDRLPRAAKHPSTRWACTHLQFIVSIFALSSMAAAFLAPTSGLRDIYLAALLSSGFLLALDARRSAFTPFSLRIAADAALLTPLAFFPALR
ncbi:MAG TPA: hypothetical protein VGR96_05570 [Acidobacteriaceae bacterium]|nr:hypothetical protein [Acidobacteriaceae bacterium]